MRILNLCLPQFEMGLLCLLPFIKTVQPVQVTGEKVGRNGVFMLDTALMLAGEKTL